MKKSNVNEIEKAWNKVAEARGLIEYARDAVEYVLNDEQEIFDNRSEKWQEGERGQEAQELLNNLETVLEALNNVFDNDTDEVVGILSDIVENN